jgi:hypothetical protein
MLRALPSLPLLSSQPFLALFHAPVQLLLTLVSTVVSIIIICIFINIFHQPPSPSSGSLSIFSVVPAFSLTCHVIRTPRLDYCYSASSSSPTSSFTSLLILRAVPSVNESCQILCLPVGLTDTIFYKICSQCQDVQVDYEDATRSNHQRMT